jgi:hypothetical protein
MVTPPRRILTPQVRSLIQPKSETKRRKAMKFMILPKADKNTEASAPRDEKLLAAMGKYNEGSAGSRRNDGSANGEKRADLTN